MFISNSTDVDWRVDYLIDKDKFSKCVENSIVINTGKVGLCEKYESSSDTIDIIYDSSGEIEKSEYETSQEWRNVVLGFHSGFGYSVYKEKPLGISFYEVYFDVNPYTMKQDNILHSSAPNTKARSQ